MLPYRLDFESENGGNQARLKAWTKAPTYFKYLKRFKVVHYINKRLLKLYKIVPEVIR